MASNCKMPHCPASVAALRQQLSRQEHATGNSNRQQQQRLRQPLQQPAAASAPAGKTELQPLLLLAAVGC